MLVKSVMSRNVQYVKPQQTIQEAAQMMSAFDVGMLPVIDSLNALLGTITDRDIAVNCVARGYNPQTTRVADGMSKNAVTCSINDDVTEAMQLMKSHQIRRLIVLDNSFQTVGILSLGDLATRYGEERKVERVLQKVSEHRLH